MKRYCNRVERVVREFEKAQRKNQSIFVSIKIKRQKVVINIQ